ncbi:MAG: hypothetical protein J7J91_01350 [Deltaproteobacteria bacterium]|nr:hypothetical protein [Deltaproteobacteria bacterium]
MLLDKESISVINHTGKKMRVTLKVITEYRTYNLDAMDFRVYDDFSNPHKREIQVVLEEAEEKVM